MKSPSLLLIVGNAVSRVVNRKVVGRAEIDMNSPHLAADLRSNLEYFRVNGMPEETPQLSIAERVFGRIVHELMPQQPSPLLVPCAS